MHCHFGAPLNARNCMPGHGSGTQIPINAALIAEIRISTGLEGRGGDLRGARVVRRAISGPLEHFDAIGFAAGRVEDCAVAYALESGAHQADSQHVANRI